MMRLGIIALAFVMLAAPARASTIFTVTGTDTSVQSTATNDGHNYYPVYGPGTFHGNITIDLPTFTVTDAHMEFDDVLGTSLFYLVSPPPAQTGPNVQLFGSPPLFLTLDLTDDTVTGYAAWGVPCPAAPDTGLCGIPLISEIDGRMTAVTPLPTTLPLFATGLGLGLLAWRRRRAR